VTTHRVTVGDFDLLIARWEQLRDETPRTDPKYRRIVDKVEELMDYRRQEFGAEQDEAWKGHGG